MKKRTILIVVALLLIPLAALSFTPKLWMRQSTGNTADAAIMAKPGYLYGIIAHTDGTNAVEITPYDNDDASSGTTLHSTWTVTTSATDRTQTLSFDPPVICAAGIYVDVSTAGTITYDVYYHASDD